MIKARLEYYLLRCMVLLCRVLPFFLLYRLSDLLYLLVRYVIRYRYHTVALNLKLAFPDKTKQQRKKILNAYYHHFCDLFVEVLKGFSMSAKSLAKHWVLKNPEIFRKYFSENRSVIVACGHRGNWEWASCLNQYIPQQIIAIFKGLHNPFVDAYFKKTRKRFNIILTQRKLVKHTFADTKDKVCMYTFITDHNPTGDAIHSTTFLTQPTTFAMGAEKYAKRFNFPVIYMDSKRIKRGYYETTATLISDTPQTTEKGEIIEKAMRLLEKNIRETPAEWMWEHRRWKDLYTYKSRKKRKTRAQKQNR